MRILLVNVPHPAIGRRIPGKQLPPLRLLSIGGPLNNGHTVRLIDREFGATSLATLVARTAAWQPDLSRRRRKAARPFAPTRPQLRSR